MTQLINIIFIRLRYFVTNYLVAGWLVGSVGWLVEQNSLCFIGTKVLCVINYINLYVDQSHCNPMSPTAREYLVWGKLSQTGLECQRKGHSVVCLMCGVQQKMR